MLQPLWPFACDAAACLTEPPLAAVCMPDQKACWLRHHCLLRVLFCSICVPEARSRVATHPIWVKIWRFAAASVAIFGHAVEWLLVLEIRLVQSSQNAQHELPRYELGTQ